MAAATKTANAPKVITLSTLNKADRNNIDFRAGDTVRVSQKIQEKGKTRLQVFEGLVLARKHGSENGATFTVRKVAGGYGIEKIFPLYSPVIDKIEVVNRAKVRRSKLYYVRNKAAKEISRQMRRARLDQSSRAEVIENPDRVAEITKEAEALEAKE